MDEQIKHFFEFGPYRLDVTDFVPEGENIQLRLELTGSCRNLLGPHHHIDGEGQHTEQTCVTEGIPKLGAANSAGHQMNDWQAV